MNAAQRRVDRDGRRGGRDDRDGPDGRSRLERTRRPALAPTGGRRSLAAALTLAMVAGTAMASTAGRSALRRPTVDRDGQPAGRPGRPGPGRGRSASRQRLEEAQQASASGDEAAAEAALSAYSAIVVEATAGTAGDPTARGDHRGQRHPPRRRPDRSWPIASRPRPRPRSTGRWPRARSSSTASPATTAAPATVAMAATAPRAGRKRHARR